MDSISILSVGENKGRLSGYAKKLLSELSRCSSRVVAVTGDSGVYDELKDCGNEVLFAEEASDVGRYCAALRYISEDAGTEFGRIIFVSDSFFGPFGGLPELMKKAKKETDGAAAWSISASPQSPLHFYFLVLENALTAACGFTDSLCAAKSKDDFSRVIADTCLDASLKMGALFPVSDDSDLECRAGELMASGFPLLSVNALTGSFGKRLSVRPDTDIKSVISYIAENTDYDTELIYEHAVRTSAPSDLMTVLGNRFILGDGEDIPPSAEKNALLVCRVFHDDDIRDIFRRLESVCEAADIMVIAENEEQRDIIKKMAAESDIIPEDMPICLCDESVDDTAAFLICAAKACLGYKYCGYAHGIRDSEHNAAAANSFGDIIFGNIMPSAGYIREVTALFERDSRLGLLVPPPPEHEGWFSLTGRGRISRFPAFDEMCESLGIDMAEAPLGRQVVFGSAFWCRCDAVRELLSYGWQEEELSSEMRNGAKTASRAAEQCMPLLARKNGFVCASVCTKRTAEMYLNMNDYLLQDLMTMLSGSIKFGNMSYPVCKKRIRDRLTVQNKLRKTTELKKSYRQLKSDIALINRSKFFNKKWYLKQYPEVRSMKLSPAEHYLTFGWRQGKDPSDKFSTTEYLAINKGVARANINPLLHYEKKGKYESGRKISYNMGDYRPHSVSRGIKRSLASLFCGGLIRKNSSARILVVLHLFYMCSWKEIKEYLRNLDAYDYDLVVTYTSDVVDHEVLEDISKYKPDAVLKECSNQGYDVGSFTEVLADTDLDSYDIIFKLQSKGVSRSRIFIYGQYLKKRDWFLNLFEGCIGAFTVHKTIDKLMNGKKTGLVGAENLIVADPQHKQNMVKRFMTEKGLPIPEKYLFVAGTCFAVKSKLMQPIKDMQLKVDDYSTVGREFSLAHKMERVVCLAVLCGGYEFSGNRVMTLRRAYRKLDPDYSRRKKYTGVRLLDDKRFSLDDEFVFFNLEHRLIKNYELVEIPLKDIKRSWNGRKIPLSECHPYKYLVTGDPKVYEEYCRLNKSLYNLDIMSRERFDTLIESIETNGFQDNNVVVVNSDNVIADGQHRCCYMLYKHGGEYKIPCLRLYELPVGSPTVKEFLRTHLSEKNFDRLKYLYHKIVG